MGLAKGIYDRLFDWLVKRVNSVFQNTQNVCNLKDSRFIGILDIFGFEDMEINGFEQLFINYTNEKLQGIFNVITFRKEEEEYRKEKIEWDRTNFPDNRDVIELIEKKPMGLLPYMDSECSREQGIHDLDMLSQWNKEYKNHRRYAECGPSSGWKLRNGDRTETNNFVIMHYAGPVIYTC